eukprot:TRINITY_DN909_c0_g1_i10.p1 TRINITY_DN909_c0_g1~~TRINITY_DN909_c0_g1_i10.p1  ORF type:complete len:952 (+),score=156.21 TRINITY_DN909_c0_g1_i10:95-2950(+)
MIMHRCVWLLVASSAVTVVSATVLRRTASTPIAGGTNSKTSEGHPASTHWTARATAQRSTSHVSASTSESLSRNRQGPNLVDLGALKEKAGLMNIFTDPADDTVLLFDLSRFIGKELDVLVSAMSAKGTYLDEYGQVSKLHEPVDETVDTMITLRLSSDGSHVDVVKPETRLRTTDRQSKEALADGAWTGWEQSLSRLPVSSNASDKVIVDATPFLVGGFFTSGWYFAPYVVDVRILSAKTFEKNIIVTAAFQLVFDPEDPPITMEIALSMLALPKSPMAVRPSDDRLQYFAVDYIDLGSHETADKAVNPRAADIVDTPISSITRFNISNSPTGDLRFYVDPTVPRRWRKYFAKAIEAWNVAFTPLGYDRAIRAVLPDTPEWPSDYNRDDARYSTISWSVNVDEVYALGLAKVDPRSGEILKSDIMVSHGWVQAFLSELDVQAPSLTKRQSSSYRLEERSSATVKGRQHRAHAKAPFSRMLARTVVGAPSPSSTRSSVALTSLPSRPRHERDGRVVPIRKHGVAKSSFTFARARHHQFLTELEWEQIVGAGIQSVVVHEMGHSLGLRHNFKASIGIDTNCLKSAECTRKHGVAMSVMDYTPSNIFAFKYAGSRNGTSEIEDVPDIYQTVIGIYDKMAIRYGYMDGTPKELQDALEEASDLPVCTDEDLEMDTDPLCRVYDLSSSPVTYWKERLDSVSAERSRLLETAVQPGESYTRFGRAVLQNLQEAGWITQELVNLIGGVSTKRLHRYVNGSHPDSGGSVSIAANVQQEALSTALSFISTNAAEVLPVEKEQRFLLERFGDFAAVSVDVRDTVRSIQKELVDAVVSPKILMRVFSNFAMGVQRSGFTVSELLGSVERAFLGEDGMKKYQFPKDANRELLAMFLNSLSKAYRSRCVVDMPVNIVSELYSRLLDARRTLQDQGADVAADPSEQAFRKYLEAELAIIDEPCA